MTISVIIATYERISHLRRCLGGLARQTTAPNEVIVIWQSEDEETATAASKHAAELGLALRLVHCPVRGIVPAENAGLHTASGDVLAFIDDDAVPPPKWIENHLRVHENESVGAVGGPALNHHKDGTRWTSRRVRQMGKITWYGKLIGNLNDAEPELPSPRIFPVDCLAGNNMSFKRSAFGQFEERLRDYWQHFEVEACFQVQAKGLMVLFDLDNHVLHYLASTNLVFEAGTRKGNLQQKVFNYAFNQAFILSRYSTGWSRWARLAYSAVVGSRPIPGPLKFPFAVLRYGNPLLELRIMVGVVKATLEGWRAGADSINCNFERGLVRDGPQVDPRRRNWT